MEPTHFHIILHHNADPDAICAAEIYGYLVTQLSSRHVYTIYSDDINHTAKRIMNEFSIKVSSNPISVEKALNNCVLTVDTANISQLGKYAPWVETMELDLLVVDHHDTSELSKRAKLSIVESQSSSTCILADKTLQVANIQPDARIATLVLSGHMYDSRRMLYGTNAEIFTRFSQLIELGGDFTKANELLQTSMSRGEKIARFKASQRLKYHLIKDAIVVTSRIGAFEASVARSYIGMGADIALVIAPKEKELRGSARCNLDINIGEIMSQVATKFGGTGGGHAAAAGFNIQPIPTNKAQKEILAEFVRLVELALANLETN